MSVIPLFFSKIRKLKTPSIGEVYQSKQWSEFNKEQFIDEVDNKVKLRLYDGLCSFWIDRKYVIFYNFKDTIEFKNKKKEIEKLKQ